MATGGLATVIAYLTLSPPNPESGDFLSDKTYHSIAFSALVFPTALLYARSLFWILPLAFLFGVAIELVQPYMGRGAEAADVLADFVGLGVGTITGLALRAWIRGNA